MANSKQFLDYEGLKHVIEKLNTRNDGKYISSILKGVANGVASLDANGKIPVEQLGNLDVTVFKVVTALPTSDIKPYIYLVKNVEEPTDNEYIEWVYVADEERWEKLGEYKADIDLTPYAKLAERNTFIGDNTFQGSINADNKIVISPSDGIEEGGIVDPSASASKNKVWATDGTVKDLEAYDAMVWNTFPLTVASMENNAKDGTSYNNSVILEKGTTKDVTIQWSYTNESYFPVTAQSLSGGSLSADTPVVVGTNTYTVSGVTNTATDAKTTYDYVLTAKSNSYTATGHTYVTFVHKSYAGAVAGNTTSLTAADIKGLAKSLITDSRSQSYTGVTQSGQKLVFCIPAYLGNITSIKNSSGFEGYHPNAIKDADKGYLKSTVNVDGVTYNVYLQVSTATATDDYKIA